MPLIWWKTSANNSLSVPAAFAPGWGRRLVQLALRESLFVPANPPRPRWVLLTAPARPLLAPWPWLLAGEPPPPHLNALRPSAGSRAAPPKASGTHDSSSIPPPARRWIHHGSSRPAGCLSLCPVSVRPRWRCRQDGGFAGAAFPPRCQHVVQPGIGDAALASCAPLAYRHRSREGFEKAKHNIF